MGTIKTLNDLENYLREESATRIASIPEWAKSALPNDCVIPRLEADAYTRIADMIKHQGGMYSRVKDLSDVYRACQEDADQLTLEWIKWKERSYEAIRCQVQILAADEIAKLVNGYD